MTLRTMQFIALVLTALALIPAGAHLFALPHKIAMGQEPYFVVQGIYRGWALFGIPLIGAIVVVAILAVMLRAHPVPFWLTVATALCLAAGLAVFFIWVFPGNQATQNWTVAPDDWMRLRTRWEYGHAASALLDFIGFCALVLSVLATRPQSG